MTPLEALTALPLWAAAGAFVAAIVARIIRDLRKPTDPINGEYQ